MTYDRFRFGRWWFAALALACWSADAQETEPPAPAVEASANAPKSASRLLEEIVVTAQKREENLADVPISVQAFSSELLDARGIVDAKDLPQATPGLTVTTQVSYTAIFLRGVGSDAWLLSDPSVATYTDGIYFPFSNGLIQDFGAVERIEILKGPQGTLFGRNAIAGAVNVLTRKPSLDTPELSLQTTFADYDTMQYRLHAGFPLTDTLAFSASGVFNDGDSHIDGTSGGEGLPKEQAKAGRIKMLWRPADWTDLNLTIQDLHQQGAGTNYLPTTKPSLLLRLGGAQPQNPYKGSVNEPTYFIHDDRTYYGQLGFYLDAFDVKLLGSDQYVRSNANIDFDGSDLPLARFDVLPIVADIQTAELQLISNDTSWGSERVKWIVGGYYFQSDAGISKGVLSVGSTNLDIGQVLGVQIPDELLNLFDGLGDLPLPLPLPAGAIAFVGTVNTESTSVYSQLTYEFSDQVSLTLGGRYQNEQRYIIDSRAGLQNFDGSITPIVGTSGPQVFSGKNDPRFRDTTKGFNPRVAIDFHPGWDWLGEDALLYASWQTSTKSSTFNVVNIYDAPEKAEAEDIQAYELGIKTRLFDGLMSLNLAAFHYTLDKPQVQVVSLLQGGAVAFENAGEARTIGLDFDSLIQLFPSLTDGLVLTFGACILDPEYTKFTDGTGFDPVTGVRTTGNDYSGNQVVRSPKFSGSAALSQTFQTSVGTFEVAADYYHTSKYYYLAQNLPADTEKAYGVLGARVSWLYEPWNLRLTAFGKNITDSEYSYSLFIVDFGTGDARAPLSTYGLRLNWDF